MKAVALLPAPVEWNLRILRFPQSYALTCCSTSPGLDLHVPLSAAKSASHRLQCSVPCVWLMRGGWHRAHACISDSKFCKQS